MAAGPKPRRGPATRTPWMPPGRGPCPSSAPRAGASQAVLAAGSGAPLAPSRFSRLPSTGLSRPPRSKSVPKKKVVGAASASTSASPTLPNFSAMEASNLSGDYSAENMFDEMPTRGTDCPETSNSQAAVTCLPDDALVEILSYLCAKTLCRFKCVSKAWCRLITDILLRGKSLQTLQGFFYGGGSDNYGDFADLPGGFRASLRPLLLVPHAAGRDSVHIPLGLLQRAPALWAQKGSSELPGLHCVQPHHRAVGGRAQLRKV